MIDDDKNLGAVDDDVDNIRESLQTVLYDTPTLPQDVDQSITTLWGGEQHDLHVQAVLREVESRCDGHLAALSAAHQGGYYGRLVVVTEVHSAGAA